jgi:hypothetical protein
MNVSRSFFLPRHFILLRDLYFSKLIPRQGSKIEQRPKAAQYCAHREAGVPDGSGGERSIHEVHKTILALRRIYLCFSVWMAK